MNYQDEIKQFARYPLNMGESYLNLGLMGEIGELAELCKKCLRRGDTLGVLVGDERVALELGDVLWYAFMLANERGHRVSLNVTLVQYMPGDVPEIMVGVCRTLRDIFDGDDSAIDALIGAVYFISNAFGFTLKAICEMNLAKLRERHEAGTIVDRNENGES